MSKQACEMERRLEGIPDVAQVLAALDMLRDAKKEINQGAFSVAGDLLSLAAKHLKQVLNRHGVNAE